GGGARVAPDGLAARDRARQGFYQIPGHRRGMSVTPGHLAEIGPLPAVERFTPALCLIETLRHFRCHEKSVRENAQGRDLLATRWGDAPRHDNGLCPEQHADGTAKRGEPDKALFELGVRLHWLGHQALSLRRTMYRT